MSVARNRLHDVADRDQTQDVREKYEEEDGPNVEDVLVGQFMQIWSYDFVANERAHRLEKLCDTTFGLVCLEVLDHSV